MSSLQMGSFQSLWRFEHQLLSSWSSAGVDLLWVFTQGTEMRIFSLKWCSQGHENPASPWEGDVPSFNISREVCSGVERVLGVALRREPQRPGPQPLLPIHKTFGVFRGAVLPQGSPWPGSWTHPRFAHPPPGSSFSFLRISFFGLAFPAERYE